VIESTVTDVPETGNSSSLMKPGLSYSHRCSLSVYSLDLSGFLSANVPSFFFILKSIFQFGNQLVQSLLFFELFLNLVF
jgi:hypothetical protein